MPASSISGIDVADIDFLNGVDSASVESFSGVEFAADPINTMVPAITMDLAAPPWEGNTVIISSDSTWDPPGTITQQEWFINGVGMGSTGASYVIPTGHAGEALTLRQWPVGRPDLFSESNAINIFPYPAPENTLLPAIEPLGNVPAGTILSRTAGIWLYATSYGGYWRKVGSGSYLGEGFNLDTTPFAGETIEYYESATGPGGTTYASSNQVAIDP